MDEGEREEELRAAVDAISGKRRERKSAAAIVEPDAEVHPEAPLLMGLGSSGENADCNSCRLEAIIEKKNDEEQGEEDVGETSLEAVVQPESTIKSGLLPWLLTNNSVSDELKDPPRTPMRTAAVSGTIYQRGGRGTTGRSTLSTGPRSRSMYAHLLTS